MESQANLKSGTWHIGWSSFVFFGLYLELLERGTGGVITTCDVTDVLNRRRLYTNRRLFLCTGTEHSYRHLPFADRYRNI